MKHPTLIELMEDVNSVRDILRKLDNKIILKDLITIHYNGGDISSIKDENDFIKLARKYAGKKRRREWPLFPNPKEKQIIRQYLCAELRKRPNVDPKLFNALFGIGFQSYFSSWNEFRKEAGLEIREFAKPAFDSTLEARIKIFEYAVETIRSGERITQEKIRKELHLHYETYNFNSMDEIKYSALEVVVYEMLLSDPELPLVILNEKTKYSKQTIKKYMDLNLLRSLASMKAIQTVDITHDNLTIWYKQK